MAPVFCRDFGLLPGMKMALFHSISSFCNAGFDLMGVVEPYSSLTAYAGNWVINLSVMPVSYTHLDVYKRQQCGRASVGRDRC